MSRVRYRRQQEARRRWQSVVEIDGMEIPDIRPAQLVAGHFPKQSGGEFFIPNPHGGPG